MDELVTILRIPTYCIGKDQWSWTYKEPRTNTTVDSHMADDGTERAIVALFRQKLKIPQNVAINVITDPRCKGLNLSHA